MSALPARLHGGADSLLQAPRALVRLRVAIWVLVAVFLVALAACAALLANSMRQAALVDAEKQVLRFASVADTVLNRSFQSIDMLLASTDDLLDLSALMVDWGRGDATSALLRSALRQSQVVRTLALVDAQGQVLASSDPQGARKQLPLPEGFLERALDPAMPSLVVGTPAGRFVPAQQMLYFARHFRLADGKPIVALAEVPVIALVPVMLQGVGIEGLQITLEYSDGTLLLTIPQMPPGLTGDSRLPLLQYTALASEAVPVPDWQQPARLDQRPGLVVARNIHHQHLWLTASLPLEDALVHWQLERRAVLLGALAMALVALMGGGLAQAYFKRARQARRTLAEAKMTLDQALESMVSGFMLLDAERQVLHWNRRFEEIFPWLAGSLVAHLPFERLLQASAQHCLPASNAAERQQWVQQRLQLQGTLHEPHEQKLPSGKVVQIVERATPRGGLVISYEDVTNLRRASAEIETLAFYDPLTGLPNRRLLLDRLRQATGRASRTGQLGAVLFLDLNQFKMLNDTQGHEVGDLLLQQVASRLRAGVRDLDTVARLGGDEFVVLLVDLAGESGEAATNAQRLGNKLLASLAQPYHLGTHHYQGACSMGATLFGLAEHSAAELLKQADIAMYTVKTQARSNSLCFFDPQMQTLISQRAQLQADLRQALVRQELVLHYQAQFALEGSMVGAEALLRWQHPERGMVSPAEFIPMAEECGLIVPIGQWVLETACAQLARWQKDVRRAHLSVSVNVSARQFRQSDLVAQVTQVLAHTGVRPQRLKFELTESLVLDNVDDTIAKMLQLREQGVQFSVDDFGTGYSSLAYLTRLPLHELKIDQSFVRNLGQRPTDDVIVQTIIGMASNLGLDVIAEGVETVQQKNFLARHGCHLYQGYLLGRPMPVAELEALPRRAPSTAATQAGF